MVKYRNILILTKLTVIEAISIYALFMFRQNNRYGVTGNNGL